MQQILIIEDDRTLNKGLCTALKADGRQIVSCLNLACAREQILMSAPSLVLLDINLPDGNGIDFLREIKAKYPTVPVILLTANDTDMDIVNGLEQGADDYITKPFSLSVLRARINTQLRKTDSTVTDKQAFKTDKYSFDFDGMVFLSDGKKVELSKTEQRLLKILTENAGNTVGRNMLIDKIWTDGAEYVDENALSVAVKRLRDKLGAQDKIKTVYGVGYKWVK